MRQVAWRRVLACRANAGSARQRWWRTRARWPNLLGFSEDDVASPLFARVFGGNALLDGMQPFAANYGGHQFNEAGPDSLATAGPSAWARRWSR